MTAPTSPCAACNHTDPHTSGGIGICTHPDGCPCDGSMLTLAEIAQQSQRSRSTEVMYVLQVQYPGSEEWIDHDSDDSPYPLLQARDNSHQWRDPNAPLNDPDNPRLLARVVKRTLIEEEI